ncbi:hypothetical protein MMC31_006370 [Peltigera leucophlebia]|nr:hypothetical protein [Peltigera leucophlebia]
MGLFVNPPFALFSLVDLPVETLNSILQQAHDGSTVDQWWLYLPSSTDYSAAPQKKPEGGGQEGTKASLPSSFKPAFVGRTTTDVAAWLKNKPDGVDLEGKFFGVLDKKAAGCGKDGARNEEGDKVVLCRIGDREGHGDKVHCVLMSAEESTLTLSGIEYGTFDQLIEGKGEYVPEI